jgi:signal transduction histidine kinase
VEKPPPPIEPDRLSADRGATDASLHAERRTTDDLLGEAAENRVDEIVRDGQRDAERQLKSVREDADSELKQVSSGLDEVADNLTKAADSLSGAAATPKESLLERRPREVVENISQVAEEVADTAERIRETAPPIADAGDAAASGKLADQLGEVAEGMAEVTATLADERRDEDDRLARERQVTDRVVALEMERIGAGLLDELRYERDRLRDERAVTDRTLTVERQHTDEAVDRVLDLLEDGTHARVAAERTVSTRNELLRMVSHDLRGPLMTIIGVAGLMEQQAASGVEGARLTSWAALIKRSVSVMDRLIHDLLDFGSFEDGQLRVVSAPHDIRGLVGGVVEAFEPVAAARHVSLAAEMADEPIVASYDHHRIFQVLSNLIHNAIKFTPAGGSIRVRAALQERECVVSVADTGIGIPKHELKSVFERFHQLDASDRRGLGLGLYIALWIVEAHGGRIWADSDAGAGTTVSFTLPR